MKTIKTAIITGAASGIGKEIVRKLFNEGYKVILIDKNTDGLNTLKNELKNSDEDRVSIFPIDITNEEDLKRCISKVKEGNKEINVLVNNAGILFNGLLNIQIKQFEEMLNIHLMAAYKFIKEISPLMKDKNKGYIFNISSRSGKSARPEYGAYAISKYALMGLNEALYEEMMPYNIKVTAICPSVTDTDLIKGYQWNERIAVCFSGMV